MPLPDFGKSWRRLGRTIAKHENVLLAILAVIILTSGGFWYRQFSQKDVSQPTVGGTYVEGIVFDSDKKELNQIIMRLTKTGLLGFSVDGNLESVLTEKWSVNDDKTEYRLTLIEGIARDEIINVLEQRTDLLGDAAISADLERDVVIRLVASDPSLPLLLTRPMFDYGPYKLGKANDQTTVFSRNTRKGAVAAYINKIIVHTYPSVADLKSALIQNRIDGAALPTEENIKKYQRYQIDQSKYYAVLFNTNKTPFRDTLLRQALTNGTAPSSQPFILTASDQDPHKTLAQDLVTKWQSAGAEVGLDLRPLDEVTSTIGPARNFQALLIGVDYGSELDPYYIWDSSQVRATGNNVTGVKDPDVDLLISQVRSTLDVKSRQATIVKLHQTLVTKGVAMFLTAESVQYYQSAKIHFVAPTLPKSSADRFLAAAKWSVK